MPYNDDCNIIASASYDSSIRFWELKSYDKRPIEKSEDFKDTVTALCIRGNCVYATSVDGILRVYDLRKGQLVKG